MKIVLVVILSCFGGCGPQGMNRTQAGTLGGAGLGAGLGAIVGSVSGNAGAGIAIGTATGALGGALIGNSLDQQQQAIDAQRGRVSGQEQRIAENQRLIDELRRRGADVHASQRGVVVNLPDILFQFDNYRLTNEARRTLEEISDVLRTTRGRTIAVEGHADSIGTIVYNDRLSNERATSVADELAHNGVPSAQMRVRGYGEGRPLATNNTEAGRARNRRVEVIVEN